MVSSKTRKIISLAISLLVVVISLTGIALGATAPAVTNPTRYTPGFAGSPGKMARDAAGNFYVVDFWGKGIVKLNRQLAKTGFLPTSGRPTAVTALADSRLIVTMSKPTTKVVFYNQATGEETLFSGPALYNPTGVTVDAAGYVYVLDSGNSTNDAADTNIGRVRVYSSTGVHQYSFGTRGLASTTYTSANDAAGTAFKQPSGITYIQGVNQVVVVDTLNGRLQYFTAYNGTSCTLARTVGTSTGKSTTGPTVNTAAKFYNPVDVAFEYNGSTTYRMYVANRGHNNIAVVDADTAGATYGYYLSTIGLQLNNTTITPVGSDMKMPSAVLYEQTGALGVGMLYTNSDAGSSAANILTLSVGGGSIPSSTVVLTMNSVSPVSATSPITVSGTTSPATAVTCSVNGGAGVVATGTASWSVSLPIVSGNNHITCQAVGALPKEADTYLGALPADTVSVTSPSSTLYTKTSSVTIAGVSGNANASVQLSGVVGGPITVQSDANKNWSAAVVVAEGANTVSVTSWKAGVTSASPVANVSVVGDFTAPSFAGISFLANAAVTNKAVQNLDGIVVDANIKSVEVNGVTVLASDMVALPTANNKYFSLPVTLVRGSNTVTIKATDLAENAISSTRTVTLIPEAPGLTVALPADNSYLTAAGTISANGGVDSGLTSVVACGVTGAVSAPNWTASGISMPLGFNSCQFTASGAGLTTVTEKRTINVGASYVPVAITSPVADLATSAASIIVSGTAPTGATPQISINGASAVNVGSFTAGVFSHTVNLVQGVNSIKILANSGSTIAVRNIVRDNAAPELGLKADSKPVPTLFAGSIEPSAKLTISATLNSVAVPVPASVFTFDAYDGSGIVTWHANLSGYNYDAISFTATDPAGNTAALPYEAGIPTGDIDGDGTVRLADALAALRHVAGTEVIVDNKKRFNGDVGGLIDGHVARDGVIDIQDSVLILNKAYGLMAF